MILLGICLALATVLCFTACDVAVLDETDATDATDALTESPTDEPTDAPTEAPTDKPTEAPEKPDEPVECSHEFGEWEVTLPATCTSEGEQVRSCTLCDESESAVIPKNDSHTVVFVEARAATCMSTGLSEGSYCSACGEVLVEQEILSALGHTFVDGECSCGATDGLAMKLSSDGSYYTVSGIGNCTDTVIVIPDTYKGKPVKEIGQSAFNGNKKITEIVIGANITDIYGWAFYQCTSLKRVTAPSVEAWLNIRFWATDANPLNKGAELYIGDERLVDLVIPDGVEKISKFSFFGCTSIQSLTLGADVKTIADLAFHSCSELASVTFNDKLETVAQYAFFGCRKMSCELKFPDTLVSIGNYAFANASLVTALDLGSSVTTVGQAAFQGCAKITEVTIPETVTYIGKYAFQYCNSLKSVVFMVTEGWKAYHPSYNAATLSTKALAYPSGAASFLTSSLVDREWKLEP